jgi:hypothetical protein
MKNTTNWIAATVIVAALFFSTKSNAQAITSAEGYRFDIGVEAGAPTYAAHRYLSNFEAGATARFQFGLSDNLAVMITSVYYNMFPKTGIINGVSTQLPGVGIIPVKVGLKGLLGGGVYFTLEGGQGYETSKDGNTGIKDTKNIISGGLGYGCHSFDLGLRYESFYGSNFNYGLVGLRLAYSFGSK